MVFPGFILIHCYSPPEAPIARYISWSLTRACFYFGRSHSKTLQNMMLKLPDSSTQRTSAKQMRWKAFYSGMRPVDAPCRWKAAFPVLSAASKDDRLERAVPKAKNLRGKWETLARCGLVFSNAESVKYIIADGHGSHLWLRQLLLGQKISLADDLLQELPFRGKLVAEDLPLVCIPLPWRIVRMDGESIHFIPGQVVKYHEIC